MIAFSLGQLVRLADGRVLDVRERRGCEDATGYLVTADASPGERVCVPAADVVETLTPRPVVMQSRSFSGNGIRSCRLVLMFIELEDGDVRYLLKSEHAGRPSTETVWGLRTAIAEERLTDEDRFFGNDEASVLAIMRQEFDRQCDLLEALTNR